MISVSWLAISALLLALSFSSFNLGFLAWCALVPLYLGLEHKALAKSLPIAFIWGVVFWLIHVTLLGQAILILYLSIYCGLFGAVVYFSRSLPVLIRLFFLPAAWVLLEYLRSYLFTGLPWAIIGFSQYRNLAVIQIADITGAWGVCFLVVLANTALYLYFRRLAKIKLLLVCLGILLAVLGYGLIKLMEPPPGHNDAQQIKVSVVQGNIPQDLKWDKRSTAFIHNRYRELTAGLAPVKPELIIWPEASVPGLWGRDEDEFVQVFALARQLDTNLLAGAVSYLEQNYFNSALLVAPGGQVQEIYHKLHLVPFGEYVPLKRILPFLETIAPIGDITPGVEYTIFRLQAARHSDQSERPVTFGVLICFEDLFPELSRELVKKGARFLVNITNDAWYKESSAPYQHFAASVFRAVENRLYLARCANTGVSGFIDPAGRILRTVADAQGKETFVAGCLSQDIYLKENKRTVYNRYGDFFILFCLLLDACAIIYFVKDKKLK